jgi:hypothetical protein
VPSKIFDSELASLHLSVSNHSMYKNVSNLSDLSTMMETHVFAVWDFMSLLKRLQRDITCVSHPWKPSPFPKKIVRLINEIVLGEESDLGIDGEPIDHFTLYVNAMKEVGANTGRIYEFIETANLELLSTAEKNFVKFNLDLAEYGSTHEVAAAFFFGREKLIPDMFTSLLGDLEKNLSAVEQEKFRNLKYYLNRHIELDGGEHSHLAHDCLNAVCLNDELKWKEAANAGIQSLKLRASLWDEVEKKIR